MHFSSTNWDSCKGLKLSNRVDNLNIELGLSKNIKHHEITEADDHQWGCYIFHKDDKGGCLEDVLLGLMRPTNETVFEQAESFISSNRLKPQERECEYKPHNGKYKNKCKFKDKKSIISVAGQLQISGMGNSVIIARSDFIKKDDILNSPVCNDIIKLFQ